MRNEGMLGALHFKKEKNEMEVTAKIYIVVAMSQIHVTQYTHLFKI